MTYLEWQQRLSLEYRINQNIFKRSEDECWNWIGSIGSHGYGQIHHNGGTELAHRIVFMLNHGFMPRLGVVSSDRRVVMHTCDNKLCCNPKHLVLGSQHENTINGGAHQRVKTHCPQGHPYNDKNTYLYQGRRYCKICKHSGWRL